jgi:aspartate-semialdehyde dehydrogenase
MLMPEVEYTAMLLGATGNVGRQILHLLVQSPLCKKVVVVTRRNVAELANPKVQQVPARERRGYGFQSNISVSGGAVNSASTLMRNRPSRLTSY